MGTAEKYPFEVLHTDGSRSWYPETGKKVWGIIIGSGALCLKGEPEVDWWDSQTYCEEKYVAGKKCWCGGKEFWESVANLNPENFRTLNCFIASLGGIPLIGKIWTAIEDDEGYTWLVKFENDGGKLSCYGHDSYKNNQFEARPVYCC